MRASDTALPTTGRGIVVVGGSLAGLHAAEALREHGYDGPVTLLGAEDEPPYDRPPLSKQVLTGEWQPGRAALRNGGELAAARIEVRVGVRATGLDPDRREVRTADGAAVAYDGLIIATGCAARTLPGADPRPGLHTLRTLADCMALRAELRAGARLVVIGAGFIGMEAAAAARSLGAEVTVVDPLPTPMQAVLGPRIGAALGRLHREHGVLFRLGRNVRAVIGSLRVEGVQLDDGTVLPGDAVLVGIGATPAVGWLADSGLDITAGLRCDEYLTAGPPEITAAGDVVSWTNPLFGERMRIEHWSNAIEQGAAAARNLLAAPAERTPFASVPYFWSDQYDVRIQFAGRAGADCLTLLEDPDAPVFLILSGRAGRLSGVLSVNAARAFTRARRMIAQQRPLQQAANELSRLLPVEPSRL
ncbi:NAD(P)/FAD-dependent oxidoreductase [Pseudonocardia hispaniensis]|uniref:NAD(P)/FAD-dependent oxidoreductase n=1 Tax=Pseudonocardia hispaniensis TaxID=904933 RepID=A0ABW1IZ94_9PSEU